MDTKQLIDLLNQDLANELMAIMQYLHYAARVDGPYRLVLRDFFSAEINEEKEHALYLAEKIITLGGDATCVPNAVPKVQGNKAMLEAVYESELQAIHDYTERSKQADSLGFKALSLKLEEFIVDETRHKEEVERLLKGW
ncbi:MAG: ferritin-like domain-containing protein [bacterium]